MKVILAYWWSFSQSIGGVEKYVLYLAKELASLRIDVTVVSSGYRFSRTRESDRLEVVTVPPFVSRPVTLTTYPFCLTLARFLMREQFDVLHSFANTAFAYLALKNRRPTAVQSPGFEPLITMRLLSVPETILNVPLAYSVRYCLHAADRLLTLGPSYSDYARRVLNVSPEKIVELPNAVPVDHIRQQIRNPVCTRESLQLALDDFVLICVGKLLPLKGQRYLLEALSLARKKGLDFKLLLVGTGPMENEIYERITKYGLSRMVVQLKNLSERELYSTYAIADLAVLPYLDVSGPDLTILEAMAAGLPVITTDVWESRSAVRHGVNGYLVPPGDSVALAEALIEAYRRRDELDRMGKASEELVRAYDWINVARKAIALYTNLA